MFVFEITIPGTWLKDENRERLSKHQRLLDGLKSQFYEANLALNLFLESLNRRRASQLRELLEADANRRSEIRRKLEEKYNPQFNFELWKQIDFEAEVIFKREQWQLGRLPPEFENKESFIYARAFLYALDAFDKFLQVLSKEEGVPERVSILHGRMEQEFPDLRGVRNTAQHLEDRARGLGAERIPQPLQLQPVQNRIVNARRGGVLMLNILNGTKYGCTMADGHFGEVDVSPESMQKLQSIFQQVMDSFSWQGPKQHCPDI